MIKQLTMKKDKYRYAKDKELMKNRYERNTIKRLSLLEELDALVTKIRREEESNIKRNGNFND